MHRASAAGVQSSRGRSLRKRLDTLRRTWPPRAPRHASSEPCITARTATSPAGEQQRRCNQGTWPRRWLYGPRAERTATSGTQRRRNNTSYGQFAVLFTHRDGRKEALFLAAQAFRWDGPSVPVGAVTRRPPLSRAASAGRLPRPSAARRAAPPARARAAARHPRLSLACFAARALRVCRWSCVERCNVTAGPSQVAFVGMALVRSADHSASPRSASPSASIREPQGAGGSSRGRGLVFCIIVD